MEKPAAKSTTAKPRHTLKAVLAAAARLQTYCNRAREAAEYVGEVHRSQRLVRLESASKLYKFRSVDEVRRAIQLVDDEKGFRSTDITALIELSKQEQYRHILRVTPLARLLQIDDRSIRMRLARRMIRQDWTQPQVEAFVRESANDPVRGPRRGGGRPPRSPTSPKQILDEFERLATKWRRFREHLDSTKKMTNLWGKIDESQRRKIDAVSVLLEGSELGHGLSIRKEADQEANAEG